MAITHNFVSTKTQGSDATEVSKNEWNEAHNADSIDVNQSNIAGGIPVIKLTQADVSEEFIRFISTAQAGDITRSLVQASDIAGMTLKGLFQIYIEDSGGVITTGNYYMPFFEIT